MSGPVIAIQFNPRAGDSKKLLDRLKRQRTINQFPHMAKTVERLTKEAQSLFLRAIQGKPVTFTGGTLTVNRITGALHGAVLGGLRYPFNGNPLRGALIVNHPHWRFVRDGVRVHDMKPALLRSPKAKVGKDGKKYLIVPIPINPRNPNGAKRFVMVKEGSRGWIYGGSAFRKTPYLGLKPRRVDMAVKEAMDQKGIAAQIRRALARDLKGQQA